MFTSWKARAAVLAVVATMAVPVLALASPAGADAGGNSANAHACQNNGWQTLFRSDGTGFKNQGDCVSYGAQGGVYASQCYSSTTGFPDFRLIAPINTFDNAHSLTSKDGTCDGVLLHIGTIVAEPDQGSANGECFTLGAGSSATLVSSFGYSTAPSNWYVCS